MRDYLRISEGVLRKKNIRSLIENVRACQEFIREKIIESE